MFQKMSFEKKYVMILDEFLPQILRKTSRSQVDTKL